MDVYRDSRHLLHLKDLGEVGRYHLTRLVEASDSGLEVPHDTLCFLIEAARKITKSIEKNRSEGLPDKSGSRRDIAYKALELSPPRGAPLLKHSTDAQLSKSRSYKHALAVFELVRTGSNIRDSILEVSEATPVDITVVEKAWNDHKNRIIGDYQLNEMAAGRTKVPENIRHFIDQKEKKKKQKRKIKHMELAKKLTKYLNLVASREENIPVLMPKAIPGCESNSFEILSPHSVLSGRTLEPGELGLESIFRQFLLIDGKLCSKTSDLLGIMRGYSDLADAMIIALEQYSAK